MYCPAPDKLTHCASFVAAHESGNWHLSPRGPPIYPKWRLPDINGLEFQAQLSQFGVRLPVIVITGHGDIPMSVRAMKHGAVDFLSKPFRNQDMIDAVLIANERDRQRRVVDHDITQLRQQFDTLSGREQQVMRLATAGRLNNFLEK